MDSHTTPDIQSVLRKLDTVPGAVEELIYSPENRGGLIRAFRHAIAYWFDHSGIINQIDQGGLDEKNAAPPELPPYSCSDITFQSLFGYCFSKFIPPQNIYRFGLWHHQMVAGLSLSTKAQLPKPGKDGYFPMGNYPEMDQLSAHYNLEGDFFEGMTDIILDSRIRFILVGSECSFFNACRHLGIDNAVSCYIRGSEGDPEYTKNYRRAHEFARAIGIRDQINIHSTQEYLFNHRLFIYEALKASNVNSEEDLRFSDFYKPPILMDELVEKHPKVRALFRTLSEISEQDENFADMLWKRVPTGVRMEHFERHGESPNRAKNKGYKRLNDKERTIAREIMGYPLMQTAFVLYWGATKFGHSKGEASFDALANYCLEQHAEKIRPLISDSPVQFIYLDQEPAGFTQAEVIYRGHAHRASKTDLCLISIGRPPKNRFDIIHVSYYVDRFLCYFYTFLLNIKKNDKLNDFQKQLLIDTEIVKLLKEVWYFLSNYDYGDFDSIFRKSGLSLFFEGKCQISDLTKHNQLSFTIETLNERDLTSRSDDIREERVLLESKIREEYSKTMPANLGFGVENGLDDNTFRLNFEKDIATFKSPNNETERSVSYLIRYMATAMEPSLEGMRGNTENGYLFSGILNMLFNIIYPGIPLQEVLGKYNTPS